MTMLKRGTVGIGLLITAMTLAGCGVPPGSAVAIGVTAKGDPVGYVLVCQGTVDTATMWDAKTEDRYGRWTTNSLNPGSFTSFTLSDPSNGWQNGEPAFTGLKAGKRYEFRVYGGQNDHSNDGWSSTYVDFDTKFLAGLTPDQVRYWTGTTTNGKDIFETVTVDVFKAHGCDPVTGGQKVNLGP